MKKKQLPKLETMEIEPESNEIKPLELNADKLYASGVDLGLVVEKLNEVIKKVNQNVT